MSENFKHVNLTKHNNNLAGIKLHRPQAHNALNMELIREMRQALREMEGMRALVLSGEGKTFWAGGDL